MSILGEILVQILGEGAVDAFSRNKKPRAPFPEGEGNASLGAVSLFSGALALLFSILFFSLTLDRAAFLDVGGGLIIVIALFSFLAALLGFRAGRKAPRVTRRNPGLALVGTCLSLPAMLLSVTTIAMCVWWMQWTS